jgi:predicted DNA-binding ribbon-helix-helix protein
MTVRTFAAWVAPIAERMRQNRAEIVEFARSLPLEAWSHPSPNAGWTYHDLLAHLADDTEKNLHSALRAVASGRDIESALWDDLDSRNARGVSDRRSHSIEQLIAEIEHDGETMQSLLATLRAQDEHRTQAELHGTFGEFLRDGLAGHDAAHLQQLRTAAATSGM